MRRSLPLIALAATLSSALQLPNLQPFLSAIPISLADYIPSLAANATAEQQPHENLKRQNSNSCPSSFNNCANLGAPGLCCSSNAICSADQAGHVACCPSGAACTGQISGVISSGSVDASGNVVGGGAGGIAGATSSSSGFGGIATTSASTTSTTQNFQTAQGTTTGNGLVVASTTAGSSASAGGGGFIVDGSSTVATPGAAVRAAEMPFLAQAIVWALQVLPV